MVVAAPKGETLAAAEGEVDCCCRRTAAVGAGNTSGAAAAAVVVAVAVGGRGRSCTGAGAVGAVRAGAAAQ